MAATIKARMTRNSKRNEVYSAVKEEPLDKMRQKILRVTKIAKHAVRSVAASICWPLRIRIYQSGIGKL